MACGERAAGAPARALSPPSRPCVRTAQGTEDAFITVMEDLPFPLRRAGLSTVSGWRTVKEGGHSLPAVVSNDASLLP